ncbi:hypothetical protein [Micromonospora sp. DT233]|uniref:hypothetical protein n=1 Tax=Micromonospora sp. DT233 TaxID=3393432 RepID=UPI003CE73D7E
MTRTNWRGAGDRTTMRPAGAAAVAGALGALGAAVLASMWRAEIRYASGCEVTNFGDCISLRVPALLVGPLLVTALVWLAVRLVGDDRALPAALLGGFLTIDAALLHQGLQPRWTPPPEWLAAILGAAGFAAGVLLAVRRMPLVVQVGAAALLLAVPYGIFPPAELAVR